MTGRKKFGTPLGAVSVPRQKKVLSVHFRWTCLKLDTQRSRDEQNKKPVLAGTGPVVSRLVGNLSIPEVRPWLLSIRRKANWFLTNSASEPGVRNPRTAEESHYDCGSLTQKTAILIPRISCTFRRLSRLTRILNDAIDKFTDLEPMMIYGNRLVYIGHSLDHGEFVHAVQTTGRCARKQPKVTTVDASSAAVEALWREE